MESYKNVDEYIQLADVDKQAMLSEVRSIIKTNFKLAEEEIAYGMPAYKMYDKPLFYFAAMKGHLGIYPTPGPIIACNDLLAGYSISKGCVRIPYNTKIPKSLIIKLVKERIKEIKSEK